MNARFSYSMMENRHLIPGGEPLLGWPQSPHDPRERETIDNTGDWLVLQFPTTDQKLEYFTRFGFLHLQLWHPVAEISVLTPSRLTDGCYEVSPYAKGRFRDARRWVVAHVLQLHQLTFPSCCDIDQLTALHLAPLHQAVSDAYMGRRPFEGETR